MRPVHAFLTAVQFLTRLPVPGGMNFPEADHSLLRDALVFFPLVGGLIGLATGAVVWSAAHIWSMPLAVLLGLAFEALLTGALHEDAVADCCDGFGGGRTREDVLRIMKDSRIGAFGMLGLTLALLMRAGCFASVDLPLLLPVAAASGGLGRWAGLLTAALVPPVADREGLARKFGDRIGPRHVALGTLLVLPTIAYYAYLMPIACACSMVALVLGTAAWAWYIHRRLGGSTGDCLGFACYVGQVLVLLPAVARVDWM